MNKLKYKLYSVYNECFSLINFIIEKYYHYYNNKNKLKKFSVENNMNPDNILKKLKSFIKMEKMLIAQTFLIISVYYLHKDQYIYYKNIISFL